MRRRGRLVVLEGGEGAGKSTCALLIRDWLKKRRRKVVMTREPGGTPLAEAIRKVLLEGRDSLEASSELLLMFAARADHVSRLIEPALRSGTDVVCDRFVDSSYAYQGAGRGLPRRWIAKLERMTLGNLEPDLVVVFDLPPAIGLARVGKRGEGKDRFERETMAFQQRVRREFLRRAKMNKNRYAVMDAGNTPDIVRKNLLRVLEQRL